MIQFVFTFLQDFKDFFLFFGRVVAGRKGMSDILYPSFITTGFMSREVGFPRHSHLFQPQQMTASEWVLLPESVDQLHADSCRSHNDFFMFVSLAATRAQKG